MQQTMLSADTLPAETEVDALPFANAQVAHLSSAFLELDEEHRIVLCLHFFERLSLAEVALVLDADEESVRAVYEEGVSRLGGRLGPRRNAA